MIFVKINVKIKLTKEVNSILVITQEKCFRFGSFLMVIKSINGEIDWCIMDEEMNFAEFLNRIDTIFMEESISYGVSVLLGMKRVMRKKALGFGEW